MVNVKTLKKLRKTRALLKKFADELQSLNITLQVPFNGVQVKICWLNNHIVWPAIYQNSKNETILDYLKMQIELSSKSKKISSPYNIEKHNINFTTKSPIHCDIDTNSSIITSFLRSLPLAQIEKFNCNLIKCIKWIKYGNFKNEVIYHIV